MNISESKNWLPNSNLPIVIAGPCSAETEEQLVSTASALAKSGNLHMLRAGIWKPRTRPNNFEGVGEQALRWLKRAKQETGLLVAIEVANTEHVEKALAENIDVLWLGARTTVNPFYVQEIANALKGVDIPVLVKNPINPELSLWLGALERIEKAGINKLMAVHRGFSSLQNATYRNAPMWEIPLKLKTLVPGLEIICDPSHIAGNRHLIQEVAQKALDLGMSGLMIESHINPQEAWSDANQQLTPEALEDLLDKLIIRKPTSESTAFKTKLEELRSMIDELDDEILRNFAARMEVVEEIGTYKKENKVTIFQIERWKEILSTRMSRGTSLALSEEFLNKYLHLLHGESIRKQTEIMNAVSVDDTVDQE